MTFSATLPDSMDARAEWPWVPMTVRSIFSSRAYWTICSKGFPYTAADRTEPFAPETCWLTANDAHPKVAQAILRHSDISLTMNTYTHVVRESETSAVNGLPDLGRPPRMPATLEATGTDDQRHSDLSKNLSRSCNQRRISADVNGHKREKPTAGKHVSVSQKGHFWPGNDEKGKTGEPGFEPELTDPESVVLPLHYSPRTDDTDQGVLYRMGGGISNGK